MRARARDVKRMFRGSFRRSLEDPQVPVSLDMGSDSRTLLVAFGGMHREMGIPPFEFFAATGQIPTKRLFVRDLKRSWYHRGIDGYGSSLTESAESLRELIGGYEVDRLVVVGSSAGGYAALAFGTLLEAHKVLSFGPQTVIDPDGIASIGDKRWDGPLRELMDEGVLDPRWTDLRDAIPRERTSDVRYEVYFSQNNTRPNTGYGRDRSHAERLAQVEGVRLYRFGRGGHMIARELRESGSLDKIIRRAVATPAGDG